VERIIASGAGCGLGMCARAGAVQLALQSIASEPEARSKALVERRAIHHHVQVFRFKMDPCAHGGNKNLNNF